MKNAYEVTRELIVILADIDRALDKKSKAKNQDTKDRLDKEIDNLEVKMYEIKNVLKAIEVK